MVARRSHAASLGLVLLLASLFVAPAARVAQAASVLQVPGDYPTITAALAASTAGDTVLVAPGTYTENVTVPDGVLLDSSGGPSVTTIDGGRAGTVAVINPSATVHGFTIQNGGVMYGDAGGVKVYGTLDGSIITNNGGCFHGSGAWVLGGTVSNNSFHGNSGWCSVSVIDGSGTIVGNDFNEDFTSIFDLSGVSPAIEGNVFRGGAWAISMHDSQSVIRNNLFLAEASTAISVSVSSSSTGPTIVNNTFVAVSGFQPLVSATGFDASTVIANNILVGHAGAILLDCVAGYDNLPPTVEANDLWTPGGGGVIGLCSGAVGTDGNVGVDPTFVSSAIGDYHLRADSPLIDAGVNDIAMAPDIDGDSRPFDGDEDGTATVDMGLDESTDPLAVVPGDLSFGDVPLARTSTSTVTLSNLGSATLGVTSVTVTGLAADDYSVSGESCAGTSLAVEEACTIPVAFTPSALSGRDATLTVTGPGGVGTRSIPLTGTGIDPIGISPASVTFADAVVGDPAQPGSITVTNNGGAPATISSISLTGDATDVTIGAETCTSAPLGQDGTCAIPFTWRPRDSGDRLATIVLDGPTPVGTRSIALSGRAWAKPSGVAWGTSSAAGPAHTWNGGSALGRTVKSGSQRLHLAYLTDRVGGKWVTDSGPKVGLYYIRSASGSTWTTPKRLNPTSEHAGGVGLASAGSKVYAVWFSQTKYVHYSPGAKRVLYVRVNTNHGASTSWRSRIRLSSTTGRVDYPVIAASGNDAHIAYTNANTGTVYVRSSRNGGLTWPRTAVGTTSITSSNGRIGFPTIAVSGSTVAVCWLSDTAGTVRCRVSTNRGVSWGPITVIGSGATGYFSVAVRGTRIVVVWPTATEIVIRQRLAGVWQPARAIQTIYHFSPYAVSVALQDPNRLLISYAERQGVSNDFTEVYTVESTDGGVAWFAPENAGSAASSHWRNDWPSVLWPTASTRYVAWNGWTEATTNYRLYLRRGTGTPVGPFVASTLWQPTSTGPSVRLPTVVGGQGAGTSPAQGDGGQRGMPAGSPSHATGH